MLSFTIRQTFISCYKICKKHLIGTCYPSISAIGNALTSVLKVCLFLMNYTFNIIFYNKKKVECFDNSKKLRYYINYKKRNCDLITKDEIIGEILTDIMIILI